MRAIRPSTRRILDQFRKEQSNRLYDLHKPAGAVRREASSRLATIDYASKPVRVSDELESLLRR